MYVLSARLSSYSRRCIWVGSVRREVGLFFSGLLLMEIYGANGFRGIREARGDDDDGLSSASTGRVR